MSWLAAWHLILLGAQALSLAVAAPASWPACALVILGALMAEGLPKAWRRPLRGEFLLIMTILGALLLLPDGDHLRPLLRLAIVAWLLCPTRPGMLRFFALLLLIEILILPLSAAQLLSSIVLSLLALLIDTRARLAHGPLPGQCLTRLREAWYPSPSARALPAAGLGIALCGLLLWPIATSLTPAPSTHPGIGDWHIVAQQTGHLQLDIHIGPNQWTTTSTQIMARIAAAPGTTLPEGALYLRALCAPRLRITGPDLIWQPPRVADRRLPAQPRLHQGPPQQDVLVTRMRGSADIVLVPDGAARLALDHCLSDVDGNVYQAGMGLSITSYAADIGQRPYPDRTGRAEVYRQLPEALNTSLHTLIPALERWRLLTPQAAAAAIQDFLRTRCQYRLTDLPQPADTPAASLLAFLTGSVSERVGHCQHFSTATTCLLRAAGHAARPVIGYVSQERTTNGLVFRALHAHAWCEVLNSENHWQRVDSTPLGAGQVIDDFLAPTATPTHSAPSATDAAAWPWLLVIGAGVLLLRLLLRRRRQQHQTDHQETLQRERERLLDCAEHFGICIEAADSISVIVAKLEHASGLDLSQPLADYLRARFATGRRQVAWPWEALREALRKAETIERSESNPEA